MISSFSCFLLVVLVSLLLPASVTSRRRPPIKKQTTTVRSATFYSKNFVPDYEIEEDFSNRLFDIGYFFGWFLNSGVGSFYLVSGCSKTMIIVSTVFSMIQTWCLY